MRQKFPVGKGAIGTELMQDFGQGGWRHGNLKEMIKERNLEGLN
jgi:hypothetical protein